MNYKWLSCNPHFFGIKIKKATTNTQKKKYHFIQDRAQSLKNIHDPSFAHNLRC